MDKKRNITVLIDFDNYFNKPIFEYSIQEFEFNLKLITDKIMSTLERSHYYYLKIRLYSGWFENAQYTVKTSDTLQKIACTNLFPINLENKTLINGIIEIATSIQDVPDYIFQHTYKEKNGVPRIRINKELMNETCYNNKDHCPAHILTKFTKKKDRICSVDGCTTNHNEIFFQRVQKMVDTMIACDIITFSENNSIDSVLLVSDDADHIPALISGSTKKTKGKNIKLIIRNNRNEEYFRKILGTFNIKTILLT